MYIDQFAGRIRFRGVVDFPVLYKMIFEWFDENAYVPFEELYKHKPPTEFDVQIKGIKKVTGYVRYLVKVKFTSANFKEVEVMKDGKKKKMFSGNMRIDFSADVETDYETDLDGKTKMWETSLFLYRLKQFFENHIYKWRLVFVHPDTVMNQVQDLMEEMKKVMGMHGNIITLERLGEQNG
jgi:hypothetical protein